MTPDLLDPALYADVDGLHDALRTLRQQGPVWRDEQNGLWAVLGHQQILDVERRSDVFCSSGGYRSLSAEMAVERDMIALDDPEHAEPYGPTASTSAVTRTRTSPSGSAPTSAWARRLPDSSCGCCSRPSRSGSPVSRSSSRRTSSRTSS